MTAIRRTVAPSLLLTSILALAANTANAQPTQAVVAVFGLQNKGAPLPDAVVEQLAAYLSVELVRYGGYKAVPDNELKRALARQKVESYRDCYAESCQIEVGRELAANKVVSGTILKIGRECIVALTLFDTQRSTKESAGKGRGLCSEEGVLKSVDDAIASLLGVPTPPDYGDPDAEIRAAETKAARGRKRRERAAQRAWKKVRRRARSRRLSVNKRIQILERHLKKHPRDNPHAAQAEALLAKLKDDPQMVLVPAGEFIMGCNPQEREYCGAEEAPRRKVFVDAFMIDKTEVSVASFRRWCFESCRCSASKKFPGGHQGERCNINAPDRDDHPVNCVNREQAEAFCLSKGKRLPTPEEWEKAARGTDGRHYPWGFEPYPSCDHAVLRTVASTAKSGNEGCGGASTWPVGSKPAGASPYGVLDMVGNIAEWTLYKDGDKWRGAMRGGSFAFSPSGAFITSRASYSFQSAEWFGFRCARSVARTPPAGERR